MAEDNSAMEELLWVMRPQLDLFEIVTPLEASELALPFGARRIRLPQLHLLDGALIATTTENQRRTFGSLLGDSATRLDWELPATPRLTAIANLPEVHAVNNVVESFLLERGCDTETVQTLQHHVNRAATYREFFRGQDLTVFRNIVVSSQHASDLRALLLAANEQSVQTVYVPHAPVVDTAAYLDLPVSVAGLRGEGERAFYAQRAGVNPQSIDIVGNPATNVLREPMPRHETDNPGVLALSPAPEATIRRLIELVAGVDDGQSLGKVIVAPHPRSDRQAIARLVPSSWEVYEGERTLDLLRTGPAWLAQPSSGVAWESAALGIPTATLLLDETEPTYPFLRDASVFPELRSSSDVATFVHSVRAGEVSSDGLRQAALTWCEVDGRDAQDRLRALLSRSPAPGTPTLILDGWMPGGVATRASGLTGELITATEASPRERQPWSKVSVIVDATRCSGEPQDLDEYLLMLERQTIDKTSIEVVVVLGADPRAEQIASDWASETQYQAVLVLDSEKSVGERGDWVVGLARATSPWVVLHHTRDRLSVAYLSELLSAQRENASDSMFVAHQSRVDAEGRVIEDASDFQNAFSQNAFVSLEKRDTYVQRSLGPVMFRREVLHTILLDWGVPPSNSAAMFTTAAYQQATRARFLAVPAAQWSTPQSLEAQSEEQDDHAALLRVWNRFIAKQQTITQWQVNALLASLPVSAETGSESSEAAAELRSVLALLSPGQIERFHNTLVVPSLRFSWLAACDTTWTRSPVVIMDERARRRRMWVEVYSRESQLTELPQVMGQTGKVKYLGARSLKYMGDHWGYAHRYMLYRLRADRVNLSFTDTAGIALEFEGEALTVDDIMRRKRQLLPSRK